MNKFILILLAGISSFTAQAQKAFAVDFKSQKAWSCRINCGILYTVQNTRDDHREQRLSYWMDSVTKNGTAIEVVKELTDSCHKKLDGFVVIQDNRFSDALYSKISVRAHEGLIGARVTVFSNYQVVQNGPHTLIYPQEPRLGEACIAEE